MPHTEHRKKTQRKATRAKEVNRARRSTVRTAIKKARGAVAEGKADAQTVTETIKKIDKAAEYGVIHPNKAARLKSRLVKSANKAAAAKK